VPCVVTRVVGHGINADRAECRPPKIAVCGRDVIRLTITWQCDMVLSIQSIGIPAVRPSDTEPVKRTERPIVNIDEPQPRYARL